MESKAMSGRPSARVSAHRRPRHCSRNRADPPWTAHDEAKLRPSGHRVRTARVLRLGAQGGLMFWQGRNHAGLIGPHKASRTSSDAGLGYHDSTVIDPGPASGPEGPATHLRAFFSALGRPAGLTHGSTRCNYSPRQAKGSRRGTKCFEKTGFAGTGAGPEDDRNSRPWDRQD